MGNKHHLRKSADRKAQIRKAFVPLTELICAFRSADFSGGVIPQAQPHAQSLFLFPIVFGINIFFHKQTTHAHTNTRTHKKLSGDVNNYSFLSFFVVFCLVVCFGVNLFVTIFFCSIFVSRSCVAALPFQRLQCNKIPEIPDLP